MTGLIMLLALLLDWRLGEPKAWHPLVGFGRWANHWQTKLNPCLAGQPQKVTVGHSDPESGWLSGEAKALLAGALAWLLAVGPWLALAVLINQASSALPWLNALCTALGLYLALGWQSLLQHARAIALPLSQKQLPEARQALAMIVSRDTEQLDESQIAKASCESVLENGSDAIFAALFWFIVAGLPGVVLYRLANTLDAMWGYKTPTFLYFGRVAARTDDLLNWLPARLCALSYCLMAAKGNRRLAWRCWHRQGSGWKSPNAGPVMASGAGALGIALGGSACYQGQWQPRPLLGPSQPEPQAQDILQACHLVNRSLLLWLVLTLLANIGHWWLLNHV